MMEINNDR